MESRGISQLALSKELRIAQPTVSDWLAAKTLPRAPQWDRLCEFFDCEPNELLSGPTEPLDSLAIAGLLESLAKSLGYELVRQPRGKSRK